MAIVKSPFMIAALQTLCAIVSAVAAPLGGSVPATVHPAVPASVPAATATSAAVHPADASAPEVGFTPIFDGTMKNWDGDPLYWKAVDGMLVGEVRPDTLLKRNSFVIWRGGELADFELKLEYRVSAEGNSGINYRSSEVRGVKWAMRGYQADIDGKDQWSGQNYEERGRTFLAYRGQSVVMLADGKPLLARTVGNRAELQKQVLKNDWNQVHIIAKGNLLQHFTNGTLMSEVRDDDISRRRMKGLLGVQVHVGPPMKIEFRNMRLKRLVLR